VTVTASPSPSPAGPRVGTTAPDFTLPSTEDRPMSLAEFRGRDVVLVFYCFDWGSI
jgi:peroxiredoxin